MDVRRLSEYSAATSLCGTAGGAGDSGMCGNVSFCLCFLLSSCLSVTTQCCCSFMERWKALQATFPSFHCPLSPDTKTQMTLLKRFACWKHPFVMQPPRFCFKNDLWFFFFVYYINTGKNWILTWGGSTLFILSLFGCALQRASNESKVEETALHVPGGMMESTQLNHPECLLK